MVIRAVLSAFPAGGRDRMASRGWRTQDLYLSATVARYAIACCLFHLRGHVRDQGSREGARSIIDNSLLPPSRLEDLIC